MEIHYELYTLKNGARILLIPSDSVNSFNITGQFKSGSALENEQNQGLTHFVEHMALTCTEKWPSKEKLSEIVEFNGGSINGATAQEYLKYYITLPKTKFDFGMEYINQVLYHAKFVDENIETERTVILDELSKYEDNVYYKAGEYIKQNLMSKKSAYVFDEGGTIETVSKFTKDDLWNQYKHAHSPNRLLLSIVGNFDVKEARKKIAELYEDIPNTSEPENYPEEKLKSALILSEKNKKTDLAICDLLMNYESIPNVSFEEYTLSQFACMVLAGPQTSRLNKRLREKEGLLYNISCDSSSRIPFGSFNIGFDVKPQLFEKTFNILNEELMKFYEDGVTQKELEHYKEYLNNRFMVRFDDIYAYAGLIRTPVFYEEYGQEVKTLEEVIDRVKSIELKDINEFIKRFFDPKKASAFAYGAVNDEMQEMMKKVLTK